MTGIGGKLCTGKTWLGTICSLSVVLWTVVWKESFEICPVDGKCFLNGTPC